MKLVPWVTPISQIRDLYFRQLIDRDGQLIFEVEAKSGEVYRITVGGGCGPYVVSDEEFLTKYWSVLTPELGRSFIVEDSDLIRLYPGVIETEGYEYKHYVVSTGDVCIEIVSRTEPQVLRK